MRHNVVEAERSYEWLIQPVYKHEITRIGDLQKATSNPLEAEVPALALGFWHIQTDTSGNEIRRDMYLVDAEIMTFSKAWSRYPSQRHELRNPEHRMVIRTRHGMFIPFISGKYSILRTKGKGFTHA